MSIFLGVSEDLRGKPSPTSPSSNGLENKKEKPKRWTAAVTFVVLSGSQWKQLQSTQSSSDQWNEPNEWKFIKHPNYANGPYLHPSCVISTLKSNGKHLIAHLQGQPNQTRFFADQWNGPNGWKFIKHPNYANGPYLHPSCVISTLKSNEQHLITHLQGQPNQTRFFAEARIHFAFVIFWNFGFYNEEM